MNDASEQQVLKSLQDLLKTFDSSIEKIGEHEVYSAIIALKPKGDGWEPPLVWKAEVIAFNFIEDYPWGQNSDGGWGTYFGPMMGFINEDGRFVGAPDISILSTEIIDYWKKRAGQAIHPVLRARYAGLVWDFSQKVTDKRPIEMARTRIDAVIDIASGNLHKYEIETIKMLGHALKLACQIDDSVRIEKVRDSILAFEDEFGVDDKPGLWVFPYDLLCKNKKVSLTEDQRAGIINKLEDRLERLTKAEKHDPWSAESAALRLAEYYRSKNDKDSVRRVLLKYGGAFEKMAADAAPMQAQAWLQDVCSKYRAFDLTDEANRLLQKIHELGPKVSDSLKQISTEIKITQEEMDSHVEEMIEGNLEDAFKKITITHLPRKNQIIKNIKDLEDESSIMNMISIKIVGHDGRPVATVGAIEDDLDGHIVMNMMQDIEISNIFLRQSIVGLVKKFNLTCDQLVEYVCHSPLFPEDRKPMLEYGLSAYLHGQAIHSIHLLIPQIEAAVRMLVQNSGGTVLQAKANSMGGYDFRAFGSLLCDETIIKIFGGEDVSLYFRVLFTDRRGINLRNNVCHGISLPETLDISMADRVVHALLLIALLRNADEENGSK